MSGATITRIEVYKLTLRKKEPFRIALGTMAGLENILVRVESSDGLYGIGEGSPYPFITGDTQAIAYEAALALARLLVGRDPYAIEARVRANPHAWYHFYRYWDAQRGSYDGLQ